MDDNNILAELAIVSYKCSNDPEWTMLYISEEIEELSGFLASDFINSTKRTYCSVIFQDDVSNIKKIVEASLLEKKAFEIEYRICHANGDTVWVFEKGKGEYNEEGQLLFLTGIIIDISNQKKLEKQLSESKEKYKYLANQFEAILDHIPGLVFYKDANNNFIKVNKYLANAYKLEKSDLEGKSLFEIYKKDVAQKYYEDDLEVINSREAKLNIVEKWETDNGVGWLNTSKIPFVDEVGEIIGVIGISFDITEKINAESKIKILQQTIEQAPDAIVITELDGSICYANKSFLEISGYTEDEVVGVNSRILKLNSEAKVDYKELWDTILAGKEWHGLFQNKNKNGEAYWERSSISPLYDDNGSIIKFIGIKEDVTKEHAIEIELEKLYRTDVLTNVSNRRSFLEFAQTEFLRNKRYPQDSVFLMLDIDYFKKVNDEFGHNIGDVALTAFASVCAKTIRTTDLIGRLGGEEFAVYLINSNHEDACIVAERLRKNVEDIVLYSDNGTKVHFTVSIGVTNIYASDQDLDVVIKRADIALYQAKRNGRNCVEWIMENN